MCSSTVSRPLQKRPRLSGYVPAGKAFVPKDTWTHEFCVLSGRNEEVTPSRERLITLADAGLGKTKITIPKMASHEEFQAELIKKFPKLKDAGGFEVLRASGSGGGQRELILIRPGVFGYTVPYLKDRMGQAIAYIRPLQRNLSDEKQVIQNVMTPKVDCVKCGLGIPMAQMRAHQLQCGGGSSTDTTGRGDVCSPPPIYDIESGEDSGHDKELSIVGISSHSRNTTSPECSVFGNCTLLKEMFPNSKMVAIRSTLDSCGGDVNKAAQVLGGWKDEDDVTIDDELPAVSEIFKDHQQGNEAGSANPLPLSVADVLHMYRKQVRTMGKEFVTINRMQISMIQQLMRIYKNPKLDLKKPLDVDFVGEQGADVGGPTKEFFHQAICALTKVDPLYNLQLFGGQEGHLIPLYGIDVISSGCFEMAGKLLAHSILHGGPGLSGLSPCIIKYLTTGSVDKARDLVTIDDLYDTDLREILETQYLSKDDIKSVDSDERGRLEDLLVKHGLSDSIPLNDLNKEKAIKDLLTAEVLVTRTLPLQAFFKGLNIHGLGDLLRKHPMISTCVLPTKEETAVNPDTLKEKLKFKRNLSEQEEISKNWLLKFVDENGLNVDGTPMNTQKTLLQSLVLFVTGTTIMDADLKIEVYFQSEETKTLLEADSCFNKLTLPICHKDYDSFKKACCTSLEVAALGYGRF